MKKILAIFCLFCCIYRLSAQPLHRHDLDFSKLPGRWDEGIPLGNATIGALVWQKDGKLHFSLDRADLWDQRPMKGLHRKEFSYQWVYEQVLKNDYNIVQQYFDEPYEAQAAPSKIPAGALEIDSRSWGTAVAAHLYLNNALCEVKWSNGTILQTFVHATKPVGWFRITHLSGDFSPEMIMPRYAAKADKEGGSVNGDDVARLGYPKGTLTHTGNSIVYHQKGWDGFEYTIDVSWKKTGDAVEGVWSISSGNQQAAAGKAIAQASRLGYAADFSTHSNWWKSFWSKSAIRVPDTVIEKQWYLEQYKFGSASRRGAPPISLQSVWTADNGRLPPWKGDYHHDLNTQLSYWPSYSANHLEEAMSYIDHLEGNKASYLRYTRLYFGKDGLAVPGVTTLDGTEMGGWIQYSCSPSISSWLSQHYYWQWRYSMDKKFLQEKAYPWVKSVALFLEAITQKDANGIRKLPISSSPEINDNSIHAWFLQTTNFDLSLIKYVFKTASEMAGELGLHTDQERWDATGREFPALSLSGNNELMVAPTQAFTASHRHFSHLMSIYPLGLIKWEDGPASQEIIRRSLHQLDSLGPDYWCGYSYSWLSALKARAKDGNGAAKALEIFATAFCSPNSFHLNGDQTKSGYSKFTYRPFTLEGNFAFAAGLQEMLLQSYAGFVDIMPALPEKWKDVSFTNLRAEGAFLVSAKKEKGDIQEVRIVAEKGGTLKLRLPFEKWVIAAADHVVLKDKNAMFATFDCKPGGSVVLKAAG
ncbi:glycoside hydrolase family 95-like protein [Chitinophaga sp. 212800010-3]|uniref:glycosyl hydrolase family 95 catalytic domain-containing protein n=1 Tax=unclassified Chitinophaga TaxID=2619133 RepID=UPI002DE5CBFF|nr:R3H domain-containing protein [Chitinophaga sp. 212800010-3]